MAKNRTGETDTDAPSGPPADANGTEPASTRKIPLQIEGLPEGMVAMLKPKPWTLVKEYSCEIYKKVPLANEPGKAGKYEYPFVLKVWNQEIDEEWLQSRKAYGRFIRIIKWIPAPGQEGQVDTGQLHVGPALGVVADPNAAATSFQIDPMAPPPAAAPAAAAAPAPVGEDAEEKALSKFLLILKAAKELTGGAINAAPLHGAAGPGPVPDWIEKHFDRVSKRQDEMMEKLERRMYGKVLEPVKPPEAEKPFSAEALVKAFRPRIEKFLDKLLGDGPVSEFLRGQVIDDPQFKTVWADETKRATVAQALTDNWGEAGIKLFQAIAGQVEKQNAA